MNLNEFNQHASRLFEDGPDLLCVSLTPAEADIFIANAPEQEELMSLAGAIAQARVKIEVGAPQFVLIRIG
jgi:hypothetical protein